MLVLAFAVAAYGAMLVALTGAIVFVGGFAGPHALDGAATVPLATALAIDVGWLVLFSLQHSVMARSSFKRVLARVIPPAAERSLYVLASSAMIALFVTVWQPIGPVLLRIEAPLARALVHAVSLGGWILVVASTFALDHFAFFGLRQAWAHVRGVPIAPLPFRTPWMYRYVRHPLYLGFLIAFSAAPTMTVGHAVFAAGIALYIAVGARLEERDLVAELGDDYVRYREHVGMLIPRRKSDGAGARSRK